MPSTASRAFRSLKVSSTLGTGRSFGDGLRTVNDRYVAVTATTAFGADRPHTLHCSPGEPPGLRHAFEPASGRYRPFTVVHGPGPTMGGHSLHHAPRSFRTAASTSATFKSVVVISML